MSERPACIAWHSTRRLADGGRARKPRAKWRIRRRGGTSTVEYLYCGTHAGGYIRSIARDQARGQEPFWEAKPI